MNAIHTKSTDADAARWKLSQKMVGQEFCEVEANKGEEPGQEGAGEVAC